MKDNIPTFQSFKSSWPRSKIDRREFLRYSTLLGMSATAAYAFVGKVTGESFVAAGQGGHAQGRQPQDLHARAGSGRPPHLLLGLDSNVVRQVCGYLTQTGHDNVTRPYLVEKWEVSDDLKTWTLRTRKDVKWHNGRQFTAEDAAWNLKHVLDPADRFFGRRPDEGLHDGGVRHRREGR